MDEELDRQRQPGRSGRGPQGGARSRPNSRPGNGASRAGGSGGSSGGLLSRFGGTRQDAEDDRGQDAPIAPPSENFVAHAPKYVPGGGGSGGLTPPDRHQPGGGGSRAAQPQARYVPGGGSSGSSESPDRYLPGGDAEPAPRYGAPPPARPEQSNTPLNDRLRSARDNERESRGAWQAFTGQARRFGDNIRRAARGRVDDDREPRAGNWKATDFDPDELEAWDREDSAPFEVPDDPDAPYAGRPPIRGARTNSGRYPYRNSGPPGGRDRGDRDRSPRDGGDGRWSRGPQDWDDEEWDGTWETGTWDTGWATGYQPSMEYARAGRGGAGDEYGDSGFWSPGRGAARDEYDEYNQRDSALAESLNTLAQLGAVGVPLGRLARLRMLLRRRPAAAALLAFFLLGFMLTCCAPLIPILRLGYDAADAVHRVNALQGIFAGGSSALFNTANLKDAQVQVDGITHDLYEINGAMSVIGAPLAAVSPQMRDYRLLVRMGFDLTASADEGLNVAETLLSPLAGGALSSDGTGITPDDITQARAVLQDASGRLQDAIDAYHSLDMGALPSQLQPSGKYGKYLGLLPTAQSALGEMSTLLNFVPAMLGIGQPAYYLVVAMDRTELRPGGGFQGNFGYLVLDGGKQSKTHPLSLNDMYNLDETYYHKYMQPGQPLCQTTGPQPPLIYWWLPFDRGDSNCNLGWGARDANLSADFPFDAQTDMQIAHDAGFADSSIPPNTQLQGVVAFTPVLIEDLLQVVAPNGMYLPEYKVTVTAKNLQHEIHSFQLGSGGKQPGEPKNQPRKSFTHDLSTVLLAKIKTLHGSALKPVLTVAQQALKDKDLQIYFSDPRAELILQQLGLASTISRGNGDGFFVVDANYGGNKANGYVTEHQTDYVTLLPNGGAVHQLQISVTYKKTGTVFPIPGGLDDYVDMQRTYMPGDATILGYSGFFPAGYYSVCGGPGAPGVHTAAIQIDCSEPYYNLTQPITTSDTAGRTMVMGQVLVSCGDPALASETIETPSVMRNIIGNGLANDYDGCERNAVTRTQNIYIEWYTPHAFTVDANGHGTYTELVEKQAGSSDFLLGLGDYLSVYVDTSHLKSHNANIGDVVIGDNGADAEAQWAALISGKKPISGFNNIPIQDDTTVTYNF